MAAAAAATARHVRQEAERDIQAQEDHESERMKRLAHEADGSSDESDVASEADIARRSAPTPQPRASIASQLSAQLSAASPARVHPEPGSEASTPSRASGRVVGFAATGDAPSERNEDAGDTPSAEQAAPAPEPPRRVLTFSSLAGTAKELRDLRSQTDVRSVLSLAADIVAPHRHEPSLMKRGTSQYFTKVHRRARELPMQRRVHARVSSTPVQVLVAALILGNFVISAVEAQLRPAPGSEPAAVFFVFEVAFNALFTVELAANLYGSWLRPFWRSPWNVFDFLIVSISWLSMYADQLPGIGVLRLFRAFRVFRLFRRVRSLRLIIEGVLASMPGVSNAFVVLVLLMGIWSIIGVEFFGVLAPQEFGTFAKAMFTMWQAMTGDDWQGIARPLIYNARVALAAPFFVSYVLVAGIVMANVVIAILLDRYLSTTSALDAQMRAKRAGKVDRRQLLRRRLWLLGKVLREGRAAVAQQMLAVRKVEHAAHRWLRNVQKRKDRPHWKAHKALASVVADTLADIFSPHTVHAHSSRKRLGLLAALWSSRVTRQALQAEKMRCNEDHTFFFAKTCEITALTHHILGFLRDAEEREHAARAAEMKKR